MSPESIEPRKWLRRLTLAGISLLACSFTATTANAGPIDQASLIRDIFPDASPSDPETLTVAGDLLFFSADDGVHGRELWRSDGTEAGTFMLKDVNPSGNGMDSSGPVIGAVGDGVYFQADDGEHGRELWRSDGSTAGTVMVEDIFTGADGSNPRGFTDFDGRVFFAARDGFSKDELWSSDGTGPGTEIVLETGPVGIFPVQLTTAGGILYFTALDSANGMELWKSDGTAGGTEVVKDIVPGSQWSEPEQLTPVGGTLFFRARPANGAPYELWKTSGTELSTEIVKDINPEGDPFVTGLRAAGDTLYFQANHPDFGREPWRSDGTEAGTFMVKDIRPDGQSLPLQFTPFKGDVYFRAAPSNEVGQELFRTDGTPEGTEMVKDINPFGNSFLESLTVVGDRLVFSAADGVAGFELWASDGTEEGTERFADINPGGGSSSPSRFTVLGPTLYFTADDGSAGEELWKAADTIAPVTTIDSGPADNSTITDRQPVFTFSSNDPPATFECRIYQLGKADPPPYGACSGPGASHSPSQPMPPTFPDSPDPGYRFQVRAIDAAGNVDPLGAGRRFIIATDPVPPDPPPDTKVNGSARAVKVQRQRGKVVVVVKVAAGERLTAKVTGPVTLGGKRHPLKAQSRKVAKGKKGTFRLRPKKPKSNRQIVRALKRGKRARANLTVTLTDEAGNRKTVRLKVTLRR